MKIVQYAFPVEGWKERLANWLTCYRFGRLVREYNELANYLHERERAWRDNAQDIESDRAAMQRQLEAAQGKLEERDRAIAGLYGALQSHRDRCDDMLASCKVQYDDIMRDHTQKGDDNEVAN